jgi:hypothetical protein
MPVSRDPLIAFLASAALAALASACSTSNVDDGGGTSTGGSTTGGQDAGDAGPRDAGPDAGQDAGPVLCNGVRCNPITPVCDPVSLVCRECVEDSDCSGSLSRKHCFRPDSGADDPFAKGYHCYQCVEDIDCQEVVGDGGHGANTNGPVCDHINYDTVFTCGTDCRADAGPDAGSECLIPDDAGHVLTPYCSPTTGKCAACLGDNDCVFANPAKPWCYQTTGACVACRGESDCNDAGTTLTPHCLIQTGGRPGADDHTCVECRNAYDCSTAIYGKAGCQPSGNVGYKGHYCGKCNAGSDCRGAPGADAGICATGFPYGGLVPASCGCDPQAGNAGCLPDAPICLTYDPGPPPLGVCGCTADGVTDSCDHSKGWVCDTQNFLVGACVQSCNLDGGCDVSLTSRSPVCNRDSGVCVGCVQDSDCPLAGQVCDIPTNICRAQCLGGCPASQPTCGSSGQNPSLCYQCQLVFNPPSPIPVLPVGCSNDSHGDPTACDQLFNVNAPLLVCQ